MNDRRAVSTPFVRFVNGTVVNPPNTLYESAQEILTRLRQQSIEEVFKALIQNGMVGGEYTVLPESTWYVVVKEFLTYYSNEFSDSKGLQALLIDLLAMMTVTPHEESWRTLEGSLVATIDDLSGWNKSWLRESAEKRGVFKAKDGNYYFNDLDGTLVQIIGATTLPETHLDFITDSIMRGFGPVRNILNLFALFAVSEDFARHSSEYPHSVRLMIPEPKFRMLSARWHRMHFHQVRTVQWRPRDIYCDPAWLAEQLLAKLTDNLDRDPWSQHVEKYIARENNLDPDCRYQVDYVLDSGLVIGDQEEIYFPFESRTFRWINGTPESQAVLSVGCNSLDDPRETETVDRLLSLLVWTHRVPIRKGSGFGGVKRRLPLTWGPRMSGGLKIDPQYLLCDYRPDASKKRNLALALYREGKNAESVFYRFLSFWKILEVAIPKSKAKRWDWINGNVARATFEKKRLAEIAVASPNMAEYLDYSGRCAIAHVFKKPVVDPDDREDNIRISQDVTIVEDLARLAINDGLAD